jgi:hypothetical protein
MKYRRWLALGIALSSLFTGYSWAQNPANAKWDEAKTREAALAISKKWNSSDFEASAAKNLRHDVYAVLPFDVPGTPRWIILIATAQPDDNCHACSPVTGAVIFALKDGSWQPIYDQAHVTDLGTFGEPPNAHVRSLGPAAPAIEFELSSMAAGHLESSVIFVAEVNHRLREILSVETGESNEGAEMPPDQTFSWQATVETSASIHEGFADIIVKSSGTKRDENGENIRPYSASTTYRFNGEVYKSTNPTN